MKTFFKAILFLLISQHSEASLLVNRAKGCAPHTKVCLARIADAAGKPQWNCVAAVSDKKVAISAAQSKFGAKICGPGKFDFSPMSCDGDHFAYAKQGTEVSSDETTGECTEFPFGTKTMACYTVVCGS